MKTSTFHHLILALFLGAAGGISPLIAQDANSSTTASASPVRLSYGVDQVVQMAHANVSDSVILNYIRSSGNGYRLDADQIIFLRQQGVSDAVITGMLNQPKNYVASSASSGNNNYSSGNSSASSSSVPTQSAPSYAAPASPPPSRVYVIPDTRTYYYNDYYYSRPYYYYPYAAWDDYPVYPSVSLSFGFGSHWGGGYRGGYYHGGYYGGGWRH